ncbi:hypothetical protein KUTeg_004705 [Tegillarca granosa]|uniref:Large ribosomal subunit protein mL43 n=1 Tax=Tegillarca granosa TaxID=220873 RepID=A0ABQ9FJI2_TEGGR|nr:hypothetical protein KUTeg_004705 [Tegillarca granosa]
MTHSTIPSAFLKNVLHNGVGRYVCQLQRITLSFCKSHGSSRGMRDFIENHLLEFTNANPGVVVYLKPRRHKAPRIVEAITVHNAQMDEICKWVEFMKTRSGEKILRLEKKWHTDNPSIQGIWDPTVNKSTSLNIAEFPSEEFSKFIETEQSTTEKLRELAKNIKNVKMRLSVL